MLIRRGDTMEIRSDRNETKYVHYLRYIFHILQQLSDPSIIAIPGETCTYIQEETIVREISLDITFI
jgi:hypothetical protein